MDARLSPGTTQGGGSNDGGVVFKITPGGALTALHSFCAQGRSCPGGYEPFAVLVLATYGNSYGTTQPDGTRNGVFRLAMGPGPFIKTLPTLGKSGAVVTISGTDLTSATSVAFNGTMAAFKVVSSSEITTTVHTCLGAPRSSQLDVR